MIEEVERAKRPKRLPVVLARDEVRAVLAHRDGLPLLACRLLYGAVLRILKCLSLRVKDIDFQRNEISVRDGKGAKDRVRVLPASCKQAARPLGEGAPAAAGRLAAGLGRAPLPFALAQKYAHADRD